MVAMHNLFHSHSISTLCVRMPNWLGDAVMALPALAMLRARHPSITIISLATSSITKLLQHNPSIDKHITFSSKQERPAVIQQLRDAKCDLGILFTNSFSSALWLYQAGIPLRVGYAMHYRSPLLTHAIAYPKTHATQHLVTTYKQLLHSVGIADLEIAPHIFVSSQEKAQAIQLLQQSSIYENHTIIGINPTAAYGAAKCWPIESFKQLTKKLISYPHIRVLFFGDTHGKATIDEICKGLPPRVVNLAGKTSLRELIALIAECHLFITNDSGPMHIAAAVKTPLLAIFGSTNSQATGPYGEGSILRKEVACSPCYLRSCPIDFRCMNTITTQEVFHEAASILHRHNHPFMHPSDTSICHAE